MRDAAAADHVEEPVHTVAPPSAPTPPAAGEWAIGIAFVLAALALVAWIGWTIARL